MNIRFYINKYSATFLSTWPRVRKAALYIAKNVFSLFNK